MIPPPKLRFLLINNISLDDIKKNSFVIYAHSCPDGVYVGVASDPVGRWQQHFADAFNENSPYYNDEFKEAIRKYTNNFEHYIVAVANFENAAKKKEAAAIRFYSRNLNMREEADPGERDYGFQSIASQIGKGEILNKKGKTGSEYSRSDSDRQTVIGEIYFSAGRNRLRSIEGNPFPAGLNIECGREERKRFKPGDKVRVKVAISEKANGTKYLTAAKTARLILVE